MKQISQAQVESQLHTVLVPHIKRNLLHLDAVKKIDIHAEKVIIQLQFNFPVASIQNELASQIKQKLIVLEGVNEVESQISWQISSHAVQQGLKGIQGIKNIIAVASGKGGVGKSTTAVNLALALATEGAQVGILDADIYGPNQPKMLGTAGQLAESNGKQIQPVTNHGIQSMSIGYLIEQDDTPMIWRGPMVTGALLQLLNDTQWNNLDYLIIDLPPGTGDIQLTLAQKIPVSAAVIVTTPQDIALLDVKKAVRMFAKVKIPVLGIIENMAVHVCSQCGHEEHIFGSGGGQKLAQQYDTELLGELPLDITIREDADKGKPIVVAQPDSAVAAMYKQIAMRMSAKLSMQQKNHMTKFPEIVVENT